MDPGMVESNAYVFVPDLPKPAPYDDDEEEETRSKQVSTKATSGGVVVFFCVVYVRRLEGERRREGGREKANQVSFGGEKRELVRITTLSAFNETSIVSGRRRRSSGLDYFWTLKAAHMCWRKG
jgi:hypothetical protein